MIIELIPANLNEIKNIFNGKKVPHVFFFTRRYYSDDSKQHLTMCQITRTARAILLYFGFWDENIQLWSYHFKTHLTPDFKDQSQLKGIDSTIKTQHLVLFGTPSVYDQTIYMTGDEKDLFS